MVIPELDFYVRAIKRTQEFSSLRTMEKNTPLAKRKDDQRHCYPQVARPDGDGPEHQKRRRGTDCSVASELSE